MSIITGSLAEHELIPESDALCSLARSLALTACRTQNVSQAISAILDAHWAAGHSIHGPTTALSGHRCPPVWLYTFYMLRIYAAWWSETT